MRYTTKIRVGFNELKLWFVAVIIGIVSIHLNLTSKANDINLLGTSILFWIAIFYLLWQKRNVLNLDSRYISSLSGILLIALVLLKSLHIFGYDPFLRIFPLISTLGVALLASGFKGLKQYWCELLILSFLVPSPGALSLLIDISPFTAQFATVILWYLGFEVSYQGVYVNLPTGGIEVYPGCSGIEAMLHLLGIAVIFLVTFPNRWIEKILLPVVALFIAFIVNGARVALMTILAASSNLKALEYWHRGDGSLIFSMIAVSILGMLCLFLLRQYDSEESISVKL